MSENLNKKFCNGCGEKILYDAKFCTKCGFKQIRIAKDKDYISNENNFINDDSKNKFEANNQVEKSKSNIGIILLSGLFIVGLLSFLFFQNNKPNNKYLTAAADSVAVDTTYVPVDTSAYADNVPVDTSALIEENISNSSGIDSIRENIEISKNESEITLEDGDFGKNLLDNFGKIMIYGSYPNLIDIFSETSDYQNLSNISISQVKDQIIAFKKSWTIVSLHYYSIKLLSRGKAYKYSFKKDLELSSLNSNDSKIYKYNILGEMTIDSESGKLLSIKDIQTNKL